MNGEIFSNANGAQCQWLSSTWKLEIYGCKRWSFDLFEVSCVLHYYCVKLYIMSSYYNKFAIIGNIVHVVKACAVSFIVKCKFLYSDVKEWVIILLMFIICDYYILVFMFTIKRFVVQTCQYTFYRLLSDKQGILLEHTDIISLWLKWPE